MNELDRSKTFALNDPNVTHIREGVTIKGEMTVQGAVVIDGTVEGDLSARSILIGPTGAVRGNIVATDADVHGTVSEKVDVKQLLMVRSSGRIEGEVTYGELAVEKGGVIAGGFSSNDIRTDKREPKPDASKWQDRLKTERVADQRDNAAIPPVDLKLAN